jgi:MinD superfamily P-loop ATPase
MKEISILSGKGGTGKTSIAAAVASLAGNAVFCDNDVDASDLHLILKPETKEEYVFESGDKAVINAEKCTGCGICISYCRFDAITANTSGLAAVNPYLCEGCRLCERICPEKAIHTEHHANNRWYISGTRFGKMIHARMGAGEENSGKLVTRLRKTAREIATNNGADYIIGDGPPGIGCPVIASLTGADAVLLITEPSLSALHDATRLADLVHSFSIPLFVVINKFDINREIALRIERFFKEKDIPVIGKIPFDSRFIKAMIKEQTIIEYAPGSRTGKIISRAWEKIIHDITPL